MIRSKSEMKQYIRFDNDYLNDIRSKKDKFIMHCVHDAEYYINKYLKMLRKQEYYINTADDNKIKSFLSLYYERKKHNLGNRLGFYIAPNCCGKGLTLFHHGSVIVNPNASIGENCKLHGNNCVGNNGKTDGCPIIGNNVDIGFGAVVIGDIQIADDIIIGANAVVTKSFKTPGVTLVGIPAKEVMRK